MERPDQIQGHPDMASVTETFGPMWVSHIFDDPNCNDFTTFSADLDGSGSTEWMVGLGQASAKLLLIRITTSPTAADQHVLPVNGWSQTGYGAAWTYVDDDGGERVYFGGNGNGANNVWELDMTTLNLNGDPVTVRRLHQTQETKKNDGMSCRVGGGYPKNPFAT